MKLNQRLIAVNFHKGREHDMEIDTIVIHVTEGTAGSVRSWFSNPAAEASAHYMVLRNGDIDHFVNDDDTAWHAGRVHRPTAAIVKERAGINPNAYSIGIEHEGTGKEDLTPEQRTSSVWLIRQLKLAHPKIQIDRRHIIGHHEVYALKSCPGAIDVNRLVTDAAVAVAPPAPSSSLPRTPGEPPRVVWSDYFGDFLIVTKVTSDTDWEFVPFKKLPRGTKAQTPLSAMRGRPLDIPPAAGRAP